MARVDSKDDGDGQESEGKKVEDLEDTLRCSVDDPNHHDVDR